MLGETWMAENWNPREASSLSVSGAWAVMTWKLDSAGVVDWTVYIQLSHGLDFPHQGLYIPWVGVWRPSNPEELVRRCLAFSDLNLCGGLCHFHCMLLVMNELVMNEYVRGMKLDCLSWWGVQGHFAEGHVGVENSDHFWKHNLSHYLLIFKFIYLSACWMLPLEHPHCLKQIMTKIFLIFTPAPSPQLVHGEKTVISGTFIIQLDKPHLLFLLVFLLLDKWDCFILFPPTMSMESHLLIPGVTAFVQAIISFVNTVTFYLMPVFLFNP